MSGFRSFSVQHAACLHRAATLCLSLLVVATLATQVAAQPAGAPSTPAVATNPTADLLDDLRDRDQDLERVARRMAHSQGAPVDGDELRRFVRSLERLDLWIGPLAEDHPELVVKHQALMARARQLVEASTRARAENADLVASDESIRRLQLDGEAYVAAESGIADATRSACEAAPMIGVETRSLSGLNGARDALVRFVAPSDGRFLVDTAGSRTDTRVEVLSGCGIDSTLLAEGDDESSLRAQTQFSARQGEAVWIRVGSDRQGHVRLSIEQLTEGVGTASITGTVIAQATALPIGGLPVRLESATSGSYFANTDASGNYQFSNLFAGSFEVYTRDFEGDWVNEIWDDIECGVGYSACDDVEGDPIIVEEGQAVTNIDFALQRSAVVSGRVVDEITGQPIAGAQIRMAQAVGSSRYAYSDETGRYRFGEVGPGTFYLLASASTYEDELFDDMVCGFDCDITTGTPVEVFSGSALTGIDFDLLHSAGIAGTVVAAASGDPIGSLEVDIYDENFSFINYGYLNADGEFFVAVPGPGSYLAVTFVGNDWVNQMWQGIDCSSSCDLSLATPIEITAANEVVEISFELTERGSIAGHVSASDAGDLSGQYSTSVTIYDTTGNYQYSGYVDNFGDYEFGGFTPGGYHAEVQDPEFRAEVYDDVACAAGNVCDPLLGLEIPVLEGETTSDIDFVLDRLGTISGRITGSGGAGAGGVRVEAAEAGGTEGGLIAAYTDENGDYELVALEPGSYNVLTESDGYLDEAFDDLPCEGGCDLSAAVDLHIPAVGSAVGGVDFALQRRAWIEGSMTDASEGFPLFGQVLLLDLGGNPIRSDYTGDGDYLIDDLEDGTYYLVTDASSSSHVNELHDDVPCSYDFPSVTCDLMMGTQVTVSVDNGAEIDFALERGGTIEGDIRDEFGNPVYDGTVYALDEMGNVVGTDSINFSYDIRGLPAGNYYLVTRNSDHQDELWPNEPCYGEPFPICSLLDGTPVSVSLGEVVTGIDFVLDDLGTIEGTVVDAASGQVVSDASVRVYDELGNYVRSSSSSTFALPELPPGAYYLQTYSTSLHIDAVYGGDLCVPNCDLLSGTPILVGLGQVVTGIEIPLPMGPGVLGRVIDGPTGLPLTGVSIDFWDIFGDHVDSAVSDGDGWYRLPGFYGTYFISTYNTDGLEDFLYDGIPCPNGSAWEGLCDPTEGTPYLIEEYSPLQRLDLPFGDPTVFTDGFESGDTTVWSSTVD